MEKQEKQDQEVPRISLEKLVVDHFWNSMGKPASEIVSAMEKCEDWVVDVGNDDESIKETIKMFESKLSTMTFEELRKVVDEKQMAIIGAMAYLGSRRAIMFHRWLGVTVPESMSSVFSTALLDNSDEAKIFIERIQNLERLKVLSEIFAPERISEILETLEMVAMERD